MDIKLPGDTLEPLEAREVQYTKYIKRTFSGGRSEYIGIKFCRKVASYKGEVVEEEYYFRLVGAGVRSNTHFYELDNLLNFAQNRIWVKEGRRSSGERSGGDYARESHKQAVVDTIQSWVDEYGSGCSAEHVADKKNLELP